MIESCRSLLAKKSEIGRICNGLVNALPAESYAKLVANGTAVAIMTGDRRLTSGDCQLFVISFPLKQGLAMKLPFAKPQPKATLRTPERPATVDLRSITVGALYRGARKGGDYFDYMSCGQRLVMLMLDIAGRRDEALNVAAFVQSTFRAAQDLFSIDDVNESVALSQLLLEVNRAIIEAAGGVRC